MLGIKRRIGYLQFAPRLNDIGWNTKRISRLLGETDQFDLMVIPELASSGYAFRDKEEMQKLAEIPGQGEFTLKILELANDRQAYIVAGFPEKDGDKYYNSCILAGPEGIVGVYRKAHLFMNEKQIFDPGDKPFSVYETDIGRIGLLICFDWAFPEAWRILGTKSAQIVAHPSNLVTPYAQQAVPVQSLMNGYFTVTANRTGTERGIPFSGKSFIANNRGKTIVTDGENWEGTRIIEVDISQADNKMITEGNHLMDDRRTDLYYPDLS